MNIRNEMPPKSDLDAFAPGQPQHRLDDKAAVLEREVQGLKAGFNRERFLYYFVIECLILALIGSNNDGFVFAFLIVAALLFSIGISRYLEFPWIGIHLERWHDLCYEGARKWILRETKQPTEVEPIPEKRAPKVDPKN